VVYGMATVHRIDGDALNRHCSMQQSMNRLLGLGMHVVMIRMVTLHMSCSVMAIHDSSGTPEECTHIHQKDYTVHQPISHCHSSCSAGKVLRPDGRVALHHLIVDIFGSSVKMTVVAERDCFADIWQKPLTEGANQSEFGMIRGTRRGVSHSVAAGLGAASSPAERLRSPVPDIEHLFDIGAGFR
jgi:hypothetical protein